MQKILITGANGFLGQHVSIFLKEQGYEVIATGRGDKRIMADNIVYESIELTDEWHVKALLEKYSPDVIIHNAALSKPGECESNRDHCVDVNVNATKYLLAQHSAHFIYISTDFIFGENGPHAEDALPQPLNFYGHTKLMAEQLVKEISKSAAIVRPVFIYGQAWPGMRPTFLHWVKSNLEQGKQIKVVGDQLRTPTYVTDICVGLSNIISLKAKGGFHLAGKDILSPYQMAITTAKLLQLDVSLIEQVTAETFPEPVARAKRSGLFITKAQNELGYNPVSFEDGVRLTFPG
jgi:dTDP-4-dehydrorhamnose reductase